MSDITDYPSNSSIALSGASVDPIAAERKTQRLAIARRLLFVFPALLFMLGFFLYPLLKVLWLSFQQQDRLTYANYLHVITDSLFQRVIATTFSIGLTTTAICLILAYPVAALLASVEAKIGSRLMFLVLVPFWTGDLVRTYAWTVLLQRNGILNNWLLQWGVIDNPLDLMFNRFGVIVGSVHVLLPYMIFPLYSVMAGIDLRLLHASAILGAGPIRTFLRVYLPLTWPGIAAGSLVVFILSIGFFITPALMGGRQDIMVANLIELEIRELLNWPLAAALAFVLLGATLLLFGAAVRWLGISRIWRGLK